jgi:hypothetical protein
MLGMWTGVKWWSTKGEIKPVKWELEDRKKKKTEKLRKAITRRERSADPLRARQAPFYQRRLFLWAKDSRPR